MKKRATLIPDVENNLSTLLKPSQELFHAPVLHFAKNHFFTPGDMQNAGRRQS
jgi:hypothetical protein